MEVPYRKLTLSDVNGAVDFAKYRIEQTTLRALTYLTDPDKKDRRARHECVVCCYGDRIGGSAMTACYCGICQKELRFSSTSIDKVCDACATKLDLCRHCGATSELKVPRTLRKELE